MARRRRFDTPPKPFDAAFNEIDKWERRVCYSTVKHEFTVKDLCEWFYPPEVLDALETAYALTAESHPDRIELVHVAHDGQLSTQHEVAAFEVRIDCDDAKICTPKPGLIREGTELTLYDTKYFTATMMQYWYIHEQWEIVRDVVRWFNDNATAGAARHYFPAMGNFLPPTHDFHKANGRTYKDTKQSIGMIAPKVRVAAETVAMATFCPEVAKDSAGMYLTVKHPSANKKSQMFFL